MMTVIEQLLPSSNQSRSKGGRFNKYWLLSETRNIDSLHSVAKMSLVEKLGFSGYNWKNSYTLFLLTVAYIFGEISHYLIGSLSQQMSRDIGYGDYSCFNNPNVSSSIICSSDDYKNNKERLVKLKVALSTPPLKIIHIEGKILTPQLR